MPPCPPHCPPQFGFCHPWFSGGGYGNGFCYGDTVNYYTPVVNPVVVQQPVVVEPVVVAPTPVEAAAPPLPQVPVGMSVQLHGKQFGAQAGRVAMTCGDLHIDLGVLTHEPEDAYHAKAGEYLSSHMLADFRRSPLLYYKRRLGLIDDIDRPAYLLGRACHVRILEGRDRYQQMFAVGGPINPKTAKPYGANTNAFTEWAAAQGKPVLTAEQAQLIENMAVGVAMNEQAVDLIVDGEAEGVVRAEYCNLPCQIRIDWLNPHRGIVDLKTCDDLTWFEADAWCRWAGRRLPTEVEWECAAVAGAALGFRWGDVWEWTAGTARPYPGFAADPWREYSAPAFGRDKVLRGASFATRARMRNARFRRFAAAERDDIFCGFRSCAV